MPVTEGPQTINDPLESVNRFSFNVSLAFDKGILRPVAIVYRRFVPEPIRDGVRNFLNNLDSPLIFANDVLQGSVAQNSVKQQNKYPVTPFFPLPYKKNQ